jgi:putative DNA primase/helicase
MLNAAPITYSLFPDEHGIDCERRSTTWGDLVAEIEQPKEHATKAAMPLIKLATFGDVRTKKQSLRHNSNLVAVYGIEGDYDGEQISIEDAAARLTAAGIEAVLFTTPSHTPTRPRWRVLAPLQAPCEPAQRRELVGVLNAALGGMLATESFTASQSFYVGKVSTCEYKSVHVRGNCLDDGPALFIDAVYPIGAADRPALERDDASRALLFVNVTDETMADLRSAAAALGPHRYGRGSYLNWREIIWGFKSLEMAGRGVEAKAMALEFSKRGGTAFDLAEFEEKWREAPHSTTYKTIFTRAQEDGWVNPKKATRDPERPDGGRVDMTDSGNVNALFAETGGDLRYITERKCWMRWDGLGWRVDESGSAAKSAALRVAEMWQKRALDKETEAKNAGGDDHKRLTKIAESYRSFAAHCRNRRGLDNMLALAARDDRFAISVSALDCDRWALGVANGVVDLRSGELRQSSRDDFITKRSPYPFHPDAQAPRWCQFIEEITALPIDAISYAARPALAAYLHRALGYSATGRVSEQKMFVGVGAGSNGKNVALDVLAAVLGPYCVQLPPDAMMASGRDADGERPTPFARNLAGARLAFGSEAKEGQKLNAAWVKKQTGDAKLTARGLHESPFTFDVTHKLFLLTNHQPHLDHMDEATRGRLHLVPFDRRWNRPGLPTRDPSLPDGDKHLMDTLLTEAEGILAWLVRGAVAYARDGLEPPAEVIAKTLDYFEQQDALGQWLATVEHCAAKAGTAAASLFGWFTSWCIDEGFVGAQPSTPHAFGRALQAVGIERARTATGTVWGLRARGADLF